MDDSYSDTSSMSEVDSNPEDDFSGRKITVKTPSQWGRPRTKDMNQQWRVRLRGGMNRRVRTWGFDHNAPPTKRLASAVVDENLSSDGQSSDSEQEEDCYIYSK